MGHPASESRAFTILIDGACPLCRREAALLRRLDRQRGRLALVDIADPAFDAASFGTTLDACMGTIHGVVHRPGESDRLVTGMEVFRHAYAAVGWGWLLAPTGWPVVRPIADAAYRWFAKNRLRFTGRGHDPGCRGACTTGRCGVAGSSAPLARGQ